MAGQIHDTDLLFCYITIIMESTITNSYLYTYIQLYTYIHAENSIFFSLLVEESLFLFTESPQFCYQTYNIGYWSFHLILVRSTDKLAAAPFVEA